MAEEDGAEAQSVGNELSPTVRKRRGRRSKEATIESGKKTRYNLYTTERLSKRAADEARRIEKDVSDVVIEGIEIRTDPKLVQESTERGIPVPELVRRGAELRTELRELTQTGELVLKQEGIEEGKRVIKETRIRLIGL